MFNKSEQHGHMHGQDDHATLNIYAIHIHSKLLFRMILFLKKEQVHLELPKV